MIVTNTLSFGLPKIKLDFYSGLSPLGGFQLFVLAFLRKFLVKTAIIWVKMGFTDTTIRRGSLFKNISLMMASTLISVLFLEGLLRLINPDVLNFTYEFRQAFRYSDQYAFDYRLDESSHLKMPTKQGDYLYNFLVVTDEYGLRTDENLAKSRLRALDHVRNPDVKAEIVHAIGDSFTMGWGVSYDNSWPAQLNEMTPKTTSVLNVGLARWGATAATGKSQELWDRFPANHVIYFFFENDFDDDRALEGVRAKNGFYHVGRGLYDDLRRYSYLLNLPGYFKYKKYFADTMGEATGNDHSQKHVDVRVDQLQVYPKLEQIEPDPTDPTLISIANYARFVKQKGARFSIVALDRPNARIVARFAQQLDVDMYLLDLPAMAFLPKDGHFNPLGNELVAKFIAAHVMPDGVKNTR